MNQRTLLFFTLKIQQQHKLCKVFVAEYQRGNEYQSIKIMFKNKSNLSMH